MTREEFLRDLIKKRMDVKNYAEFINMPYSTLRYILKNISGASVHNLFRICEPLGIKVDDLKIAEDVEGIPLLKNNESTYLELAEIAADVDTYDYLPYSVSAGLLDEIQGVNEFDTITVPNIALGRYAHDKDLLFMHVNGDSMDKVIDDGALIAVKRGVPTSALNDKDIVVMSTDEGFFVKAIFKDLENNQLIFKPVSNNPKYLPLVRSLDEITNIIGKVVSFNVLL